MGTSGGCLCAPFATEVALRIQGLWCSAVGRACTPAFPEMFPCVKASKKKRPSMLVWLQGETLNLFASLRAGFALGCVLLSAAVMPAFGQSVSTASRTVVPSAFAGITGTYTGLYGGRNLGITAGLNLGFRPFFGFLPAIQVRGTYPVDNGSIVGQEHVEGGLRVQKRYRAVRPYADFLFGRGEMNYQNGGLAVPLQAYRYVQTTSNVISPGIGLEADITPHVALMVDGQFQIWQVPFDPSGQTANSSHIFSLPGTIGLVYRFGWLQHGHPAP